MTTDERITTDLAIVARTSRARPAAIADTLRAVGAVPADALPRTNVSPLALLHVSRVYVARVGRMYAGVAAITCVLGLVAGLHFGNDVMFDDRLSKGWVATLMVAIAIVTYGTAAQLAHRSLVTSIQQAANPLEQACRLASRAAGWATASTIAGAMTLVLFFGMMQVVLGGAGLNEMGPGGMYVYLDDSELVHNLTLVDLLAAFAASWIAALVVSRAWQRERRWMIPLGIMVLAVTVLAGLRLDPGPIPELRGIIVEATPLPVVRSILTATGTAGLFLIVAAVALGIRRREDAMLAELSSPPPPRSPSSGGRGDPDRS